ncbi:hypothetical protein HGM15179_012724 [Zosterops borbonicus]|uniref:ribonuclease H n=1 Tax=Zosterops borbonicus TaxID=364589 RepID=A0A8K1G9Y1_9PASS|nr:hypothetical protein HGM15179_012724 [Zosterops borbonicus]
MGQCIETNEDGVECLWVRIKGEANKADIVLGVCYRPPNQEEEVDNLFYKQLENVSGSSALVLVGDFKLPDISWELNTAEKRQSRKFLECMDDNFLSQLVLEGCKKATPEPSLLKAEQSQFSQPFLIAEVLHPSDHLGGLSGQVPVLPVLGPQSWMPSSRCVNCTTQYGVTGKVVEDALYPFVMSSKTSLTTTDQQVPFHLSLVEVLWVRNCDRHTGTVVRNRAAHQAIIHHYMDDVLVCAPNNDLLAHALDLTVTALVAAGFELQESKIQKMLPWKYLGLEIGKWTTVPQKLAIRTKIETLADVHHLCGALNWLQIRPVIMMFPSRAPAPVRALQVMAFLGLLQWTVPWIVPQPKANVWRTLTQAIGQDHICLSQASAKDPISSCLMGIPFKEAEFPLALLQFRDKEITRQATLQNRAAIDYLLLLHHYTCEEFKGLCSFNLSSWAEDVRQSIKKIWDMVQNHELRRRPKTESKDNLFGDGELKGWVGSAVKTGLLVSFFLLIIAIAFGVIKRFTQRLITDATSTLSVNHIAAFPPVPPEYFELQEMPPEEEDLDPEDFLPEDEGQWPEPFEQWPTNQQWFGDLYPESEYLAPQQANLTSNALSDLLKDKEITRQATLQNRAAIDYLLLLHHYTCEEFKGLCSFNLSSWAEDVRQSIKKIWDMVQNHELRRRPKTESKDNLFGDGELKGWVGSAVKTGLLVSFFLLIIAIAFGVIKRFTQRLITDATSTLSVNHIAAFPPVPPEYFELQEMPPEEEDLDPEDFLPEDEGQWPEPFEQWPTNQQWFGDLYPESEYLAPQVQFTSF